VELLTLSASHLDLDLDLLEQLSSGAGSIGSAMDASIIGCVVLATCNRFELYLDARDAEVAAKAAVHAVVEATGLPSDDVASVLRVRRGARDVAEHLFGVAAGLESMVVGEREVAGQVRRALAAARADGTTTPALERLFQTASRASRAVVARTGLGSGGRSVVTVALDLAARDLPLAGARVLLIGTGSYASAAVGALTARGVGRITVHSPSGRADDFARGRGLGVVERLADGLADADLVVGCSGAAGPVLGADDVRAARAAGGGPSVLVDLALRHDVDPAVRTVGLPVIDLATVREHVAPLEVGGARRVVAEHAARFEATLAEQELVPALVALRAHVHDLLEDELRRTRAEGTPIEPALRRFAARLLHLPAVRARDHARRGEAAAYRDAVETLLGLGRDGDVKNAASTD
jgi:glutamyl-tRNA reductase